MPTIAGLAFTYPWLLTATAVLPVLWWLLRVTPPPPRRIAFPALRLLAGLDPAMETPHHTPWWLIVLRVVLALLLILGLADPIYHPAAKLSGTGPLVVIVDNGWAAARNWSETENLLRDLLARAAREGRSVALVPTANPVVQGPATLSSAEQAAGAARLLQPRPWPDDRRGAAKRLANFASDDAAIYWISDGLETAGDADLVARLGSLGIPELHQPLDINIARLLSLGDVNKPDLRVIASRLPGLPGLPVAVHAYGEDGALLADARSSFPDGADSVELVLKVPLELRNRLSRITLDGEAGAGATLLLDNNARRGAVGLLSQAGEGANQPLLSAAYYIGRAIEPYAELRRGDLGHLLESGVGMLVVPDGDVGDSEAHRQLAAWVEKGGVLLRFAGPELAAASSPDDLLPVTLRHGGRSLGGVMSWEKPAHLAVFNVASPFAGLRIPPDVTIQRQVLAEPTPDLDNKSWAQLSDGTPLVTAEPRGKGFVVLVHTSANSAWSNLVFSGLFVDMLRRLDTLGRADANPASGVLPPWQTLDGFGRLINPPAEALPLHFKADPHGAVPEAKVAADHPPGFYGSEDNHTAFNLSANLPDGDVPLHPLRRVPAGWTRSTGGATEGEVDLRAPLLTAALALALADTILGMALRGLLRWRRVPLRTASLLVVIIPSLLGSSNRSAWAQSAGDDTFAIMATSQLHFGYILTGDPAIDGISKAGLAGLDDVLQRRTSVDAGDPIGIDPERNELVFFPLIYWPVTPSQHRLSPEAVAKVNRYLQTGGTLLIDTRDQGTGLPGAAGVEERRTLLRSVLAGIRIPPLVPVPADHVLTRSFYLMQEYPGRWAGGTVWVEPADDRVNDGVSTIVMGANDWASAWAIDGNGDPEFPVVPGGEMQREQAYRFGVNLVMYALTGNYKADQVHVPSILERLGE